MGETNAGTVNIVLRANLVSFKDDMGNAAGTAKQATKDLADGVDVNMREARGSIMMLEHEIGIKLPREMNTLIAGIPGIGEAFEALLPVLAAVFVAGKIYDFIEAQDKLKKAADELANKYAADVSSAFNKFGDEMLQAGIKADELRGDHLAALNKEIELINHHSMRELEAEFTKLAADADKVFDRMHAGFLSVFVTDDAKKKFEEFRDQYQLLLASNKGAEAEALRVKYLTEAKALAADQVADMKRINDLGNQMDENDVASLGMLEMKNNSQNKYIELLETTGKLHKASQGVANLQAQNAELETEKKIQGEREKSAAYWKKQRAEMNADVEKGGKLLAHEAELAGEADLAVATELRKGAEKANKDTLKRNQEQASADLAETLERYKAELAALEETERHKVAMGKETEIQALANIAAGEQAITAAEVKAITERQKALDKSDKDQLKEWEKLKKEKKRIIDQSNKDIQKDQDKANEDMIAGYKKVADHMAASVAKQIVEGKGLAKDMKAMGEEMAENFIKNMLLMKPWAAKEAADKAAAATPGPPPAQTIAWVETFVSVMALETGGPTVPGQSYLIGEKGPEIWTPGASGFVTPNDQLSKAVGAGAGNSSHHNGNVTMQISTPDANSFKKSQSQILAKQHSAARVAKQRNG